MARRKKTSSTIEKAQQRLSALVSIDAELDLGNDLTIPAYRTAIANVQTLLERYNTLLSQVDGALNDFSEAEKQLKDLSERMLLGIGFKFGKESSEYEMAGGVRKSERKRATRKSANE